MFNGLQDLIINDSQKAETVITGVPDQTGPVFPVLAVKAGIACAVLFTRFQEILEMFMLLHCFLNFLESETVPVFLLFLGIPLQLVSFQELFSSRKWYFRGGQK